jgi:hypothetical protein
MVLGYDNGDCFQIIAAQGRWPAITKIPPFERDFKISIKEFMTKD